MGWEALDSVSTTKNEVSSLGEEMNTLFLFVGHKSQFSIYTAS